MGTVGEIEVFQYSGSPDVSEAAWEGWAAPAEAPESPGTGRVKEPADRAIELRLRGEFEQRMVEETRRAFEAGRERGRQEGRLAEHEARRAAEAEREERQASQAAALIESFTEARDRFLERVEQEVVMLALAVAARILRREAQMDPLLLTGAVRVALGQLAESTEVRLRVPADDLELWAEAIKLLPNLALKPTLVAGEGMRLGDCEIEAGVGSVDLGIRAQLGEIERGFFDRARGALKTRAASREEAAETVGEERR